MRTSIVTFAAVVALAACGGDGGSTGAGPSTSAPAASAGASGAPVTLSGAVTAKGSADLGTGGTLALGLGDSFFAPTYVKAGPGAAVVVTLTNSGAMPHTFTVDSPKVDVTVAAGGTGTAAFTLPKSGALRFYCRFHAALGMQGAFYDQPGATVSGGGEGGAYGQ
jgi:plastocyanin